MANTDEMQVIYNARKYLLCEKVTSQRCSLRHVFLNVNFIQVAKFGLHLLELVSIVTNWFQTAL